MSEATNTATNFTSLPRELRDQIYDNLLTAKYRVDMSPAIMQTLPATSGNWSCSSSPSSYRDIEYPAPYNFELPSSRLGILQTSSAISQEALQVLYKQSTFRFIIDGPVSASKTDMMDVKATELMQHFEIYLSLVSGWDYAIRPSNARLASLSITCLISIMANSGHKKKSCVIRILHFTGHNFLLDAFAAAVMKLTGFETVMLQLLHEDVVPETNVIGLPPSQSVALPKTSWAKAGWRDLIVYEMLDEILAPILGPSEEEPDCGGWYVLIYHPQSHVNKSHA